ncbi:cytochrome P450 [Tanacetum coccineum]
MYDAYMKEKFYLHAMIFYTINDFPTYGNLSGYSMKGKHACSVCEDETSSRWLDNCKKIVFIGHRRSLPSNHPYRGMSSEFDGHIEYGRGIRLELAPVENDQKRTYLPPACYTMSKAEKTQFCKCLHDIKVPSGYSAKIRSLVSMKDCKLQGMKSHDCHVLMAHVIPITIRVIDLEVLDSWQRDIIITLCQLEMYFPPSFFDVMVHLVSQIVSEIKACGPIHLHNMFPFERYIGVVKGYVRNRSRPEGSIVEGYASEEVIYFYTNYLEGVKGIGVPQSRHVGRLHGVGTVSSKHSSPDHKLFEIAHFVVLEHMTCVAPYIQEHMEMLRVKNIGRTNTWYTKRHNEQFATWLKDKVAANMGQPNVDRIVERLGEGPRLLVKTYQGYEINGYTFYTKERALDCYSGVKVDEYGFTLVDLGTDYYTYEPFIIAKQATQIFFVQDPSNPRWHVVMLGKQHILGVDNVVDEEEYNQFEELLPFSSGIPPIDSDTTYLRSDHDEGLWVDTPSAKRSHQSEEFKLKSAKAKASALQNKNPSRLGRTGLSDMEGTWRPDWDQLVLQHPWHKKSKTCEKMVKGDKEIHQIVDIEAIQEKVTKTVTAAFQEKFDGQKNENEGLKAIMAHLQGRESLTYLGYSCASNGFDDLEDPTPCDLLWPYPGHEFRVAIGKVYPTRDATLHGSFMSEGYIKVQVDTVEDAFKAILVPKETESIHQLEQSILEFIEWP